MPKPKVKKEKKLRNKKMVEDAHNAQKDLQYLVDVDGYTLKDANDILQYREKIAYMHPEKYYEKIIRDIYNFIETVHPALGLEVHYSDDAYVNNDVIDEFIERFCIEYGGYLNTIEVMKNYPLSDDYKEYPLDPEAEEDIRYDYYFAIRRISEFNPVFRKSLIPDIGIIWKVQDILANLE